MVHFKNYLSQVFGIKTACLKLFANNCVFAGEGDAK